MDIVFSKVNNLFLESCIAILSEGDLSLPSSVTVELYHLSTLSIERVSIILFKGGQQIEKKRMDINTGTGSRVYIPFDKVKSAVEEFGADEIYVVHNHPAGQIAPSDDDHRTSGKLQDFLPNVKMRFFTVGGNNVGAYGTDVQKPEYLEFSRRSIIGTQGGTKTALVRVGTKVYKPDGTPTKQSFSRNVEIVVKPTDNPKFYKFDVEQGQHYLLAASDINLRNGDVDEATGGYPSSGDRYGPGVSFRQGACQDGETWRDDQSKFEKGANK
jgi:hypothetical protein